MGISPGHRKLVRHYDDPGDWHELTFSCYQRRPLLVSDVWRAMLSGALDRAIVNHKYLLTAFVYMPEHVHLLVRAMPGASGIEHLLKAIKRPFSFRIKQLLAADASPLLDTLTIRQQPGVESFRFWQEGPGYDRNVTSPQSLYTVVDYIHRNPIRRGLCDSVLAWRWSSARFYEDPTWDGDAALPRIHGVCGSGQ